ncbi:hypothetical protein EJ04DRAFT_553892 [Polyplosphaeria fusca]|uniref:Uncharacterized protein n=1 Tax=Polyplosphaeria fusca TaxID=682080 RepID=A0A9P4QWW9_9PLEO|nr:hypothetical protein EJ04DRAFT_553892 [Polyplosphaeria fusca]
MEGSTLKNLDMFRKLCGDKNLKNVVLATTKWSRVRPDVGARREQELSRHFWATMIERGSRVARVGDDESSTTELVMSMAPNKPMILQLQEELAAGRKLFETAAGSAVEQEIRRIEAEYRVQLAATKLEMHEARSRDNKRLRRAHRDEMQKLEARIEELSADRRKLRKKRTAIAKCSRRWWQRSWHCLELCGTKTMRPGVWTCTTLDTVMRRATGRATGSAIWSRVWAELASSWRATIRGGRAALGKGLGGLGGARQAGMWWSVRGCATSNQQGKSDRRGSPSTAGATAATKTAVRECVQAGTKSDAEMKGLRAPEVASLMQRVACRVRDA